MVREFRLPTAIALSSCLHLFACGGNHDPTANDDATTVVEDGSVTIDVLDNDWDLDEDSLEVVSATASGGGASATSETVTYAPPSDFNGNESITYKIEDGEGGSASATVAVTVTPVNDPPEATPVDPVATTEDSATELLALTGTDVEDEAASLTVSVVAMPAGGWLDASTGSAPLQVLYTPHLGFAGTDSFSFVVIDSEGAMSAPMDVTVEVSAQPARALQLASGMVATGQPVGPAAIGGTAYDGGPGDFLLVNARLAAVVDEPGVDLDSPAGDAPLCNGLALTGGSLVDLAATGNQDRWQQLSQVVVGEVTLLQGNSGASITIGGPAFIDPTVDFVALGVAAGDVIEITSGLNTGRAYRVGAVVASDTVALFVPPGVELEEDDLPAPGDLSYVIRRRSGPFDLRVVYDDAVLLDAEGTPAAAPEGDRVTLRLSGAIVQTTSGPSPDGTAVVDGVLVEESGSGVLSVETDYTLAAGAGHLVIETRVLNPAGGLGVGLVGIDDLVTTGSSDAAALPAWTPRSGFVTAGLGAAAPTPYVGFWNATAGRFSHAMADVQTGRLLHASDGELIAVNGQLPDRAVLPAGASLTWQRIIAVGDSLARTSAVDLVIRALASSTARVDANTGRTVPNDYVNATVIRGRVSGAGPGTMVVARQIAPALWFDVGPPFGVTPAPGFYPSSAFGGSGSVINATSIEQEVFELVVPQGFAGLSGTAVDDLVVPSGMEAGTSESGYVLEVTAGTGQSQRLQVDVADATEVQMVWGGDTGLIDIVITDPAGHPLPAKVLVLGVDPDGTGPAPRTPDPVLTPAPAAPLSEVHLVEGRGTVEVPPGAYVVLATRGLEYSVDRYPAADETTDFLLVGAGQTVSATLELSRLLDADALPAASGAFASPLRRHLATTLRLPTGTWQQHAETLRDRLVAHLAAGIEVAVVTGRDQIVVPFGELAALDATTALSLDSWLHTQVGLQVSPEVPFPEGELGNTTGAYVAWPLSVVAGARRAGAPMDEYRSPAHLYDDLTAAGASTIQLSLPRYPILEPPAPPLGAGLFTNQKPGFAQPYIGLESLIAGGYATPLRSANTAVVPTNDGSLDDLLVERTAAQTAYGDFDSVELLRQQVALYDIVRLDWYAMTSAGIVRTATATTGDVIGFPRLYVYAEQGVDGDVSDVDDNAFNRVLLPRLIQPVPGVTLPLTATWFPALERAGAAANDMEVLATSGPVVFVEVDADEDGTFEAQVGDMTVDGGTPGTIVVRVTVLAAPWVPVDAVQLLVNGGDVIPPGGTFLTGLGGFTLDLSPYVMPPTGDPFSTYLPDVVRVRWVESVSVPPGSGDAWLIVEARGAVDTGSVFARLAPGVDPVVGWTNPIFIDLDDNGQFDPPGVP